MIGRLVAVACALASATAAAEPAGGGDKPLPVDVTATVSGGWHSDDADYGELFGRINAAAALSPWQLGLRIDTATFVDETMAAGIDDRYTVEKASASWTARSLELTAGDAYVSFGRGLALSLRKLDELGIDTTLRGAKLLVHHGDVAATVVAGTPNINNVDETTGTSVDDPYDLVGGAQAQLTVADAVTVGGYAAAVAFREPLGLVPLDHYTDRALSFGLTAEAPRLAERFAFSAEAIGQAVSTEPEPEDALGFGLYGTATAYLGPATLLFEGKAYGTLIPLAPELDNPAFDAVAYNFPPTVERVLQVLENPQREIAGGRLRVDWTFSRQLLAYVNYGAFVDRVGYADPGGDGAIRDGTIQDPYGGVELRAADGGSWALISGGWRVVTVDGVAEQVRADLHAEVEASHALDPRWSVTVQWLHDRRRKHESEILDERFHEGTLIAGLRWQPWLSFAAGYDYTTEPTQPRRDYWNANVGWDITPSSSLRLFVGSIRGGLRCVSGACRVVPPFEGVKLTATLRF